MGNMKKHKRKLKKNVKIALIAGGLTLGIILIAIFGWLFGNKPNNEPMLGIDQPEVNAIAENNEELKDLYKANKKINKDYVGIIKFDSGLVDLPFVQSHKKNISEAYLEYERKDWKTKKEFHEGSIFMDPNNKLDDQNLVLYGHYVYPQIDETRTHKFTPLHKLRQQEFYEENKNLSLFLENEERKYEVVYVYYANVISDGNITTVPEGMEYMRTNFNEEELKTYKSMLESKLFYDTGKEITMDDKFITLQTCVQDRDDLRLIIVAKEISRNPY